MTARYGYGRVLLVASVIGNGAALGCWRPTGSVADVPALLAGVFLLMGLGIGVANVHAVSLRQTAVAPELRGRVNAYRLGFPWGAIPARRRAVWSRPGRPVRGHVLRSGGHRLATVWVAWSGVPRLRPIQDAAQDEAAGGVTRSAPGR